MSRKKPTPNYDIMFDNAVYSLQMAYLEYKEARKEQLRWTFFDNNGIFCFFNGYKERKERVDDAEKEVARLIEEVERLRQLKDGEDMRGEST